LAWMPSSIRTNIRRYIRLSRYAHRYRREWALIVVVTLLSSCFSIVQPWPMKILVDHVLGNVPLPQTLRRALELLLIGDSTQALLLLVVLAGLAIFAFNSAIEAILTLAWIKVGQRMVYDLARDVFAHIQRQSLLFHSRQPVGDSISRIVGDSWCVHNIVGTLLFAPCQALITMSLMLAVMLRMDTGLTVLSLCVGPLAIAVRFLLRKRILVAARARREIESRIQSHIHQTLSGISVVQAFAQEERAQLGFRNIANSIIQAQRNTTFIRSISKLSSGILMTIGTALVLFVGARRVLSGHVSVGSLLVFLSYLKSLQGQMNSFVGVLGALQGTSANIDRVMEILEKEPEVKDQPGALPLESVDGGVCFEGICFGYERNRAVLEDISFEVQPGSTVAIVGATGAGKSTLVSLIPRFFDPWKGRVTIDGHDLRDIRLKSLRQQVGIVLQEPFLFPITIAQNIAYGRPDATPDQIEQAARAANAHQFIERLPAGYETVIGERGATLSGGERQRLAIARALLKDAPILILDEPTSSLDSETEAGFLEALRRLMKGRTTLIIAHRLSTIRRADQILLLAGGRIVERGTHEDLLARRDLYARFHSIQLGEHREFASYAER
jgi:ABC-type multidrug transport system fused ATPase/permease subunit